MANRRNEKQHEEIKTAILEAAEDIIKNEGVEGVTIRKITKSIGYSPGIVYHYFANKDEIVHAIFAAVYQQMMGAVQAGLQEDAKPQEQLKRAMAAYVGEVRKHKDIYRVIMTSTDPEIVDKTAMLRVQSAEKSPGLRLLIGHLTQGMDQGVYREMDVALSAQIMWSSLFGLSMRVAVEDVDNKQVERLLAHHYDLMSAALTALK